MSVNYRQVDAFSSSHQVPTTVFNEFTRSAAYTFSSAIKTQIPYLISPLADNSHSFSSISTTSFSFPPTAKHTIQTNYHKTGLLVRDNHQNIQGGDFLIFGIMGAGLSQDKGEASNQNKKTTNSPITCKADAKATRAASTQVLPPHNWEGILKDADSPIDKSSTNMQQLPDQLYAGIFLNQNRQKYWVDKETNNNCFMLFARDLSITWAQDSRYWKWPLVKDSSNLTMAVAELLDVCWLDVRGRFQIANLSPGTTYEVIFIVKLNDPAYGWEVPVNLRLTLPDRSIQEHKENLMEKPRGQWIQIPAGEVKASTEKVGEIEFSIYEYEGLQWKRGLLVKGVSIQPKA